MVTKIKIESPLVGVHTPDPDDLEFRNALLRLQGRTISALTETHRYRDEEVRVRCRVACVEMFMLQGNERKALETIEMVKESTLSDKDEFVQRAYHSYIIAKYESLYPPPTDAGGTPALTLPIRPRKLRELKALLHHVRDTTYETSCSVAFAKLLLSRNLKREALDHLLALPPSIRTLEEVAEAYLCIYEEPDKSLKEINDELFLAFPRLLASLSEEERARVKPTFRHFVYVRMAQIAFQRNDIFHGLRAFFFIPTLEKQKNHAPHFCRIISDVTSQIDGADSQKQFLQLKSAAAFPIIKEEHKRLLAELVESGFEALAVFLAKRNLRKEARAVIKEITIPEKKARPHTALAFAWIRTGYLTDAVTLLQRGLITTYMDRQSIRESLAVAFAISNMKDDEYSTLVRTYRKEWVGEQTYGDFIARSRLYKETTSLSKEAVKSALDAVGKIRDIPTKKRAIFKLIEIFFFQKAYRSCHICLKEVKSEPQAKALFTYIERSGISHGEPEFSEFYLHSQKLFL